MGCSGCGKRNTKKTDDVMGGYKYLNDRQIRARLERYKKRYCTDCDKASRCDYVMYVGCKKENIK